MQVSGWWIGLQRCAMFVAMFALSAGVAIAGDVATQTNDAGGVSVKATPRMLSAGAPIWEFEVSFDTRTVPLTGDPSEYSRLVDSRGREHVPLFWDADPPGERHRKAVVRFEPIVGETKVALRIKNIGGVPVREFRWTVPDR